MAVYVNECLAAIAAERAMNHCQRSELRDGRGGEIARQDQVVAESQRNVELHCLAVRRAGWFYPDIQLVSGNEAERDVRQLQRRSVDLDLEIAECGSATAHRTIELRGRHFKAGNT